MPDAPRRISHLEATLDSDPSTVPQARGLRPDSASRDGQSLSSTAVGAQRALPPEALREHAPLQHGPQQRGPGTEDDQPCAKVALVAGSTPRLSYETHALLRTRLRAAAVILVGGFSVFLAWRLWMLDCHSAVGFFLLCLQGGIIAALLAATGILFRICPKSLKLLRLTELTVFGLPAGFFCIVQVMALLTQAEQGRPASVAVPWLLLIFVYATFIPNTWQRAAGVVSLFVLIPIVLAFWAVSTFRTVAEVFDVSQRIELCLVMGIAGCTAVYGVYTVGSLRREVFEARQLGQYRLKQQIGAGGMGEVYLAEHRLLKRPCAIKLIRPQRAGDPQALARFEREVTAAARLSHWNTIEIFDYGHTEDGTFYYVMEYLPGLPLDTLVERHGALSPARTIYLLRQVCDGLREAHEMGLIHRDIKPSNIIAAHRGGVYDVAKLLDFGLVKPIHEKDLGPSLTHDGGITGSPLYLSPEQAVGDRDPDARSDLYSLGAVAYFLLTGRPPFVRDRTIQVLMAHAHDEPIAPGKYRPDLPADLEAVILRLLAKKAEDRFADVVSLERALAACEAAGGWTREDAALWWQAYASAATAPEPAQGAALEDVAAKPALAV